MSIDLGPIQFDEGAVLRQLRNDLRDDWFPDPRRYEDIFKHGLVQEAIASNFTANQGKYRPTIRDVFNVPKANFTLRYALECSLADRATYHGLVAYLVPFYDALIPWNVFSHRYSYKKKQLFKRGVEAWQDFIGVVRAGLKTNGVLLSTDLTNYFENIDLEKLARRMLELLPEIDATPTEKGHIRTHLQVLFDCLKDWAFSPRAGLPQNRDASSFLASMYMLSVDRAMLDRGYEYFRYVDDIKILCSDKFHARRALKDLSLALRELGLSINSGKTEICDVADAAAIDRCLGSGGDELRHIAAIWNTRSLMPITRSVSLLKDLTLRVLRANNIDSREFRYCVHRLRALATCPEFCVPPEFFEHITQLVVEVLESHPATTDKLAEYLSAVQVTAAQLKKIADYLRDPQKSAYTWQNYRLWNLLVQKDYRSTELLEYARHLVGTGEDNGSRCGATLYLGALGTDDDRIQVAKGFSNLRSFIGQRIAILAVQELDYEPDIRDFVRPYLREDLKGVYRELHREPPVYVLPPEPIPLTSILDSERDYE